MKEVNRTKIKREVDSWFPYRRGLRPPDCPAYDRLCNTAIDLVSDDFLRTRILASEGLFMTGAMDRERQINEIKKKLENISKKTENLLLNISKPKREPQDQKSHGMS